MIVPTGTSLLELVFTWEISKYTSRENIMIVDNQTKIEWIDIVIELDVFVM